MQEVVIAVVDQFFHESKSTLLARLVEQYQQHDPFHIIGFQLRGIQRHGPLDHQFTAGRVENAHLLQVEQHAAGLEIDALLFRMLRQASGTAEPSREHFRFMADALKSSLYFYDRLGSVEIDKLLAPLTLQSEQAAKNLPGASEMIEQIGKRVGQGAPAAAHQMLSHFKDVTWHGMNSFVHGGIHPLRRSADGFPVDLALQVLRSSNGLTTMTGMTMAVLTGDEAVAKPVSKIQPAFADCLPDLLKP